MLKNGLCLLSVKHTSFVSFSIHSFAGCSSFNIVIFLRSLDDKMTRKFSWNTCRILHQMILQTPQFPLNLFVNWVYVSELYVSCLYTSCASAFIFPYAGCNDLYFVDQISRYHFRILTKNSPSFFELWLPSERERNEIVNAVGLFTSCLIYTILFYF